MMGGGLWKSFIFMELESFVYYFMINKTLKMSQDKQKLMYLDKFSPMIISKALWDKNIHTL